MISSLRKVTNEPSTSVAVTYLLTAQWDKVNIISGCHDRPIYSVSCLVDAAIPIVTTGGGDDSICLFTVENDTDDEVRDRC